MSKSIITSILDKVCCYDKRSLDNSKSYCSINDTLLPREYSSLIFRISDLFLISAAFALYKKYYDFVLVNIILYFTSTAYWYKPQCNIYRIIDLVSVFTVIAYTIYRAMYSNRFYYVSIGLVFMFLFYCYGWYNQGKNNLEASAYAHCFVHISGFICNMILYSGCFYPCK